MTKAIGVLLAVLSVPIPEPSRFHGRRRHRIGIVSAVSARARLRRHGKRLLQARGADTGNRRNLGTENIVQALLSDSLQFGDLPPNLLLTMRQQGSSDVKLICGSFNGTTYSLVALPMHKKIEDLKGAKLGMSSITSASTLILKQLLKDRGLLYPRDYSLISIGGAAVISGGADRPDRRCADRGTVEPIAIEQGFSNLVDAYKVMPEYQLTGTGVREVGRKRIEDSLCGISKPCSAATNGCTITATKRSSFSARSPSSIVKYPYRLGGLYENSNLAEKRRS